MFIKTIKVKKNVPFYVLTVLIAVIIVVLVGLAAKRASKPVVYQMKTETQRQAFLKDMGWKVGKEFEECKSVTIPKKFNAVYTNYNKLQQQQGMGLEDYRGKKVEIYSYKVYNYTGYEKKDCVLIHLMVYSGKLIGGDVCSTEIDGFMQGLRRK